MSRKIVKAECARKDTRDAKLISALIDNGKIEMATANKESVGILCKGFKINVGEAESLTVALKKQLSIIGKEY